MTSGERANLTPVFHVELRQFPHVARAFNLSGEELETRFLAPWLAGDVLDYGDRRWAPERSRMIVLEGSELRTDELGIGRGWSNALRVSEDVTERMLDEARRRTAGDPELDQVKQELLALCAVGRLQLSEAVAIAASLQPGSRVSEQLALGERAVWELLHEGRVCLSHEDGLPVEREQWQPLLLAWPTWRERTVFVEFC